MKREDSRQAIEGETGDGSVGGRATASETERYSRGVTEGVS